MYVCAARSSEAYLFTCIHALCATEKGFALDVLYFLKDLLTTFSESGVEEQNSASCEISL